jgi:Trypsin-co-occurring domain 2
MRRMGSLEARLHALEARWRSRRSTLSNVSDVESVDVVIAMIGDALRTSGLLDAGSDASVRLQEIDVTLNIAAVHEVGGALKFSVFGLEGDLDGSRRTDDTHTVQISFQPQDLTGSGPAMGGASKESSGALAQRNELLDSFRELRMMVSGDRGQARPKKATIVLNFVVDEDFSVSLVAAGQAETSTTHAVRLLFDRP